MSQPDLLALLPKEPLPPEPPFVPVDRTAEIAERWRAIDASRSPPGLGCGCARCKEPVPEPAFPGWITHASKLGEAQGRRLKWVRDNGVRQGKMREPGA